MASQDAVQDIDDLDYDDRRRHSDTPTNDNQALSPLISSPHLSRIPQSDSGICLTPQSQASIQSPEHTQTDQHVLEHTQVEVPSHHQPETSIPAQANPSDHVSLGDHGAPDNLQNVTASDHIHAGQTWSSDNRSPTPSHGRRVPSKLCRSGGSQSRDEFTCQTKYLVLQFLHQSTTERSLLHLSQNSLSTTSESEPMVRSFAQRLRQQWQKHRSHSSPTSPQPGAKSKPFTKLKGSRSSPNLKDANFFKNVPPGNRKKRTKPPPSPKAARSNRVVAKRSPTLQRRSPVETPTEVGLIRSVSENTENSEGGTYVSDADDELDTSFDSSMQGSTTSISLRNKLAQFHQQVHTNRLPTVHSEAESVVEGQLSAAEESFVDDSSPLPFLNLSNIQQQAVSASSHYDRVNDYLDRMSDSAAVNPQAGDTRVAEMTNAMLDNADEDEVDSPPFHLLSHPDQALLEANHLPLEQGEDGAVSGGFELNENQVEEEEQGACGGVGVDDVDNAGHGVYGRRPDRSRLTLDLSDQDTNAIIIDAVHSLQQEIEEELSSFESEYEEALQSLQSDHSGHTHGLSHSRSVSPDTAEIARKLARIGDDVQVRYFDNLDRAVGRLLLDNCAGLFNYENFREAAMMALDRDLNGWKQIATLLLYSQHVALHLAKEGRTRLHRVVDFTVQLLADTAADFIIQQGGWASIAAMDQSSTPSTPEISSSLLPLPHVITSTATTLSTPSGLEGPAHHRSSSAPELHPPAARPDDPCGDTTDGLQGSAGGNAEAAAVQPSVAVGSTSPSGVENPQVGTTIGESGDSTEVQEGGGSGETDTSTIATPAVLTGCAVAVAGIAVGAAVAISIIRS